MATPNQTTNKASVSRARRLRRNMTDAERKLWNLLRRRAVQGLYFRRQVPIGPYIVDFLCTKEKLVLEVDGGQHNTALGRTRDERRSEYLSKKGYTVLRFWNHDVLGNTDGVCAAITDVINNRQGSTPPNPPPQKEEGFKN